NKKEKFLSKRKIARRERPFGEQIKKTSVLDENQSISTKKYRYKNSTPVEHPRLQHLCFILLF
ncbi:MAG: hypothetical protein KJ658_17460, partial [Proteobacteria bacterium]|nr:hypothetical protein [Pseudomonadota bacterium]